MILRIGTYNVHNTDGGVAIQGMGEEIKSFNLDLVGLQELDVFVRRSGCINTATRLAINITARPPQDTPHSWQ